MEISIELYVCCYEDPDEPGVCQFELEVEYCGSMIGEIGYTHELENYSKNRRLFGFHDVKDFFYTPIKKGVHSVEKGFKHAGRFLKLYNCL